MLKCIGEKNIHELSKLCENSSVDASQAKALCELAGIYGTADAVMPRLRKIITGIVREEAIAQFEDLIRLLSDSICGDILRIDFSVVSDMKYYNGIVFKGFVEGVPMSVLSGGQYDRLMQKMGHKSHAIGFAVYLDTLQTKNTFKNYDADILLLYDETVDFSALRQAADALSADGSTVQLQRIAPEKARYRRILRFENGEVKAFENDA